tara:strand:- start:305 stop:3022 length:2718 start_codon:yes stop_codon:yes gene_type:complete
VPKQIYKIDKFHGGLNTQANPSDIDDNQFVILEDAMVDELGKIKMMGGINTSVLAATAKDGFTRTMIAGYGIHPWKSDYTGAEDKGSGEATTGDEYVAFYDGHDGQVWIYSDAESDWDDDVAVNDTGVIDIGSSNTSTAKPCFYSVDGGLRVCDGNHASTNTARWYQYIDRTLFQSIADTVSIDQWYEAAQAITSPDNTSEFDQVTTAVSESLGETHTTSSIAADTSFITSKAIYDTSSNVVNMKGGITVVVRVTTASYTSFPSGSDLDIAFTITTGSGTSSSWHGDSGTNYKVTSIFEESASATPGSTKDITIFFAFGNDYHNGSATGSTFDTSDTTNGIRTILSGEFFDATYVTSIALHSVSVQESNVASIGDHASLTINNIWFECDITAAPDGDALGWDSVWEHGISYVYDKTQESLIRRLFDSTASNATTQTIIDSSYAPITKFYIKHGGGTSFNRRITGAVWYIRDASGTEVTPWTAQIEYDFIKGVARVVATGKELDIALNALADEYYFEVDHEYLLSPNLVDTYQSRTGVSDTEKAIKASYSTAVVAGRRTYIGNVKILNEDGTTEVKGDGMLKSPPNQFDKFPSSFLVEATVNDGESIVKLETFADRILQFKEETLYVINISQDIEFLEDVHKYKGVSHPSMVCKTDYGIAWVNKLGCYLYDGRQVTNLLEKGGRKLIDDDIWQAHVIDAAAASSMIGYLPKKRQLIVVKDNGANANAGNIFLYDMVTQSWTFGDSKMTDNQIKSNFIVFQNELVYMHTNTTNDFLKWNPAVATSVNNFQIVTKDIDFGEPGRNKKIYKVLVTYTTAASGDVGSVVTVKYDTNGRTTFDKTFANGTNFSSNVLGSANGWQVAQLKPGTSSEANNIKSFQLKFSTAGTVPVGFRINDISIVYRAKRPR